jgi:hypothetical protein
VFSLSAANPATTRGRQSITGVTGAQLGKINNRGEIAAVQTLAPGSHSSAGLYRDGTIIDAGVPFQSGDYGGNYPLDLNENGQLLITRINSSGLYRLYLWENGTAAATLLDLPYTHRNRQGLSYQYFFGGRINNSGTVVGSIAGPDEDSHGVNPHSSLVGGVAYSWRDGLFRAFGPPYSSAADINDAGQIVGAAGDIDFMNANPGKYNGLDPRASDVLLWQPDGSTIKLGFKGYATAISEDGAVLGAHVDQGYTYTPGVWLPDQANGSTGTFRPFAGLPVDYYFQPTAINRARDVVGTSSVRGGGSAPPIPFFIPGGVGAPVDLNTLIPSDSGWQLQTAASINDAGQITGSGAYTDPSGTLQHAAYLLTPSA